MKGYVKSEFLDTINYAICRAVNEYLGHRAIEFFEKVGEYHLDKALEKDLIEIKPCEKPLDTLLKIAKYLEAAGYMERILVDRLEDNEALVEMYGVSVTQSSAEILRENKAPSHYMTNIMLAALKELGIQAELEDVEFDEAKLHFKERWKIIGKSDKGKRK